MKKTFSKEQFQEFCKAVDEWSTENKQPVRWSLYGIENSNWNKESAIVYWNNYVKDNKSFTIIDIDDMLIGVLHTDKNIELAYDNWDKEFNHDKLKNYI